MTKEETKKAIKIMQAYINGEKIEVITPYGSIISIDNPSWDWENNPNRYRVVPTRQSIENIVRDLCEDEEVIMSHYDKEDHVILYIDGAHFLNVLKNTFKEVDFSKAPKKPTLKGMINFICSQYHVK